jgi:phospholipid/cholesterol/gamma-HCH transport system substrate-binding protein
METRPPSYGQIAIAVGFALSCFALLLALWLAFGGPVPLKPKGYRVTVPVREATQLAVESDVRISGVSVGKVKQIELGDANDAEATIEVDSRYAPIPSDTRAILRQKTLLGETYIELTPGSAEAEPIPEGGELASAQVANSVQLDEIFRTFDEPTREAFRVWMQDGGTAVQGRGGDLNAALGTLDPFTQQGAELLRTLDRQRLAVGSLVRDGGEVFAALSERPGALRGLIENTETVFSTTAARNAELADLFTVMPTFLRESRLTLDRLDRFAADTDPLITQLRPVARELSPTLVELGRFAPTAETFFTRLLPVTRLSKTGFTALRGLLDGRLPPLLTRLTPFTKQLIPVLEVVRSYRREVTAFVANASAATNAFLTPPESEGRRVRYLRTTGPLNPELLAGFPERLGTNRTNPYVKPGGYSKLAQTLESFQTNHCGAAGATAILDLDDAAAFPGDLLDRIYQYAFTGAPIGPGNEVSSDDVLAPPCTKQAQYQSVGGGLQELSDYLHVRANP